MYKRITFKLLTFAIILAVAVPAAAQTGVNYKRMDRDLRIMENVLETILDNEDIRSSVRASKIKGVYLENHGVVFMMNASTRTYKGKKAVKAKEGYNLMIDELHGFLLDYSSVIKQLSPNDWITLVVNTTGSSYWVFDTAFEGALSSYSGAITIYSDEEDEKEEFKPNPFIMSVKKSAVDRARSAGQTAKEFAPAVSFTATGKDNPEYTTPKMHSDIKIMRNIIETALETRLDVGISGESFQGTYLKDFGVLFTVNTGSSLRIGVPGRDYFMFSDASGIVSVTVPTLEKKFGDAYAIELKEIADNTKESKKQRELEKKRKDQERINNLIEVFTEVIGDYGPTMRDLKPTEKITILYSSSSSYWGSNRGKFNMMISANFKDVQDYSRGTLSFEEFKNKVTASTFE